MATQLKKTVMPSGGDYTALETCMNANEQDLTTADQYFDVEIDGTWSSADTTAVTIHNYTTDATRYINIYTTATARHDGTIASGYKLDTTTTALYFDLNNDTSCIKIQGIIFDGADISSDWQSVVSSANYNANVTFAYNIIKATTSKQVSCLSISNFRGTTNLIYNNILYNAMASEGHGIASSENSPGTTYIYNNTIYYCKYGMRDIVGVVKNNLILNCTVCFSSPDSMTGSHNVTSDETGDDSPLTDGQISKTSYTDYFVDTTIDGGEDFHLLSTCEFIGDGTDLSATFTDDIDGDTRSSWDIGADEYVAAGGWTSGGSIVGGMII